jgi:hypothetical protein
MCCGEGGCIVEIKARLSLINARSNPISSFFIGLTGLLLLIALNHWLFAQFFKPSYLQWYFSNAAAIGIGSAVFSTIWGVLDEHPEVISAHPMKFAGAYMRLIGTYLFALSINIKPTPGERSAAPDFDSIAGVLLWAILAAVIILGLLVVGPLQYFVFLICGSPGRLVSRSDRRVILHETNDKTELREIRDGETVPPDWQDISLRNKPFTLTNVIVGLLAGVLKLAGLDTVL